MRRRALVLARQFDQGNRGAGAPGLVCLGAFLAVVAKPARKEFAGAKVPAAHLASVSTYSAERLVRFSLLQDGICFRQSGIFSLQRRGHAAAVANPAGVTGSPVADCRLFSSFAADSGCVVRNGAASAARPDGG